MWRGSFPDGVSVCLKKRTFLIQLCSILSYARMSTGDHVANQICGALKTLGLVLGKVARARGMAVASSRQR
jgi:hypothetical protein